ncbi:hypothetical protein [Chitinophaga costaii]|uniref:hypothetical protein n=1 Tax=Chitinophaga costaii TaxID=1335309 RepID=UPI0013FD5866|nr:hypothetical protein [Chitinophaga costaii]
MNIVNFIRLLEPRDPAFTQEVLYQTVVEQVKMMKQYYLNGRRLQTDWKPWNSWASGSPAIIS